MNVYIASTLSPEPQMAFAALLLSSSACAHVARRLQIAKLTTFKSTMVNAYRALSGT
jgi:hypothetical protein